MANVLSLCFDYPGNVNKFIGTDQNLFGRQSWITSSITRMKLILFTLIFIITRTQKRKPLEELKTLDICTRLLDNAAFVYIHVVKKFSKDFSEVGRLRSPGFQL